MDRFFYFGWTVLLVVVSACSTSSDPSTTESLPEGYSDAGMIELEESLRIGEETGTIFGGISGVVANDKGYIFVADYENTHIRVFSPEGDSLATFGRKGEGPGEFQFLSDVDISERGLAVFDRRRRRITVFGDRPPFEVVSTVELPVIDQATPGPLLSSTAAGFLMTYSTGFGSIEQNGIQLGPDRRVTRIDTAGETMEDSLLVVPGSQTLMRREGNRIMFAMMPFSRGPKFAVGPSGTLYYGRTDSLLVESFTPNGEHVTTVEFPYEYMPISEAEIDSLMSDRSDWTRQMVKSSDAVNTRPAFDQLLVDDQGRLWIDVTGELSDRTTPWRIVDFETKTVRQAELPKNVSIESIREGKIYGVQTDEYGVDEVVVFRIDLQAS